jgi:membrane protein YdbS with pleckstrin-like domain
MMNITGKKNLQGGEVVIYYPQLHWMFLFKPVVCLAVSIALFLTRETGGVWIKSASFLPILNTIYLIGILMIFILAAFYLLRKIIEFYFVYYSITNKRLIFKKGLLTSSLIDIPIEKIESIKCVQSLLGRSFNYGTIVVSGIGGGLPRFSTILKPYKVRRVLNDIIDNNRKVTVIREDLPRAVVVKKGKTGKKVPEVQYGVFVTSYPAGEREVSEKPRT